MSNSTTEIAKASDSYTTEEALKDGWLVEPMPASFPKMIFTHSVAAAIKDSDDIRSTFVKQSEVLRDAVLYITKRWDQAKALGMTDADARENVAVSVNCLDGNITGKLFVIVLNEYGGLTIMFQEDC